MKNLERAVRVFRALVESPVSVDSSTVRAWPQVQKAIAHNDSLLMEMKGLPQNVRDRVLAYVSEFEPLAEDRQVYQFPDERSASAFVHQVTEDGGMATHLDGGGLVSASTVDPASAEHIAASLGGNKYSGPTLGERFEWVDTKLPYEMLNTGMDGDTVEKALVESIYRSGDPKTSPLTEGLFVGIKADGPLDRYKVRLEHFCRARDVLGVPAQIAEATRLAGLCPPEMLSLLEAGSPPVNSTASAQPAVSDQGSDRGGIAKDQPDARHGQPADSRSNPQEQNPQPTEHVPTQEEGGNTNAVQLPDGTEVPMDTMRQAFAKMLQNMATQLEQGTVGGQPTPRGVGQMDAAGEQPPEPSQAQQQVDQQTQSQQQAQMGDQTPGQPGQQPEQGAQPAPSPAPDEGPAAQNVPAPQDAQQGQQQPSQQQAQPQTQPGGDAEQLLAAAEQGDQSAIQQLQGMQDQLTPEQQQRLQALLQQGQAPQQAPPQPAQESLSESRQVHEVAWPSDLEIGNQGPFMRDFIVRELVAGLNPYGLSREALADLRQFRWDTLPAVWNDLKKSTRRELIAKVAGKSSEMGDPYSAVDAESINESRRGLNEDEYDWEDHYGALLVRNVTRGTSALFQGDDARRVERMLDRAAMRGDRAVSRVMEPYEEAGAFAPEGMGDPYSAVGTSGSMGRHYSGMESQQTDEVAGALARGAAAAAKSPAVRKVAKAAGKAAVGAAAKMAKDKLSDKKDESLDEIQRVMPKKSSGGIQRVGGGPSKAAPQRTGGASRMQSRSGGIQRVQPKKPSGPQRVQPKKPSGPMRVGAKESVTENLRDAIKLLHSPRETDIMRGINMVRESGLKRQPSRMVEDVLEAMNELVDHKSKPVRTAVRSALDDDGLYAESVESAISEAYGLDEKSPKGWEGTVKAMKKHDDIDNPWALAHWMKGKGYKSHKKEGVEERYVRAHESDDVTVWVPVQHAPMVVLPEGLDYGAGEADPGTRVAVLEAGQDTSVVRVGDATVRVSNSALQEREGVTIANGFPVESYTLEGLFNDLHESGVSHAVLVVAPPMSGKSRYIKERIGPWIRRMQERVFESARPAEFPRLDGVTSRAGGIEEMRVSVAKEDFAALREAAAQNAPKAFDASLLSNPRFRYVSESGPVLLRDYIDRNVFESLPTFRRYYAHPKVQEYYEKMGGDDAKLSESQAARARDARESVLHLGKVAVVDCDANTDVMGMMEAAKAAGMGVSLAEMSYSLDTALSRGKLAGLSESQVIREYNAARKVANAIRRDPRLDQYVSYSWRPTGSGPFEGHYVAEGKFKNRQIVKGKDIDAKDPPKPKMRKQITVGESRRQIQEQLDVGQEAEAESCAEGMKEAGQLLKQAREALFKLTTSTLVQCASMAQATGAKKTKAALDQAQQVGAGLLDDLQSLGQSLDKANEVMKGENGGMGGDNVDQVQQMQQAQANGQVPAAPNPAVQAPMAQQQAQAADAVTQPAAESVERAFRGLMETDIPERVLAGEDYRTLNEAISGHYPELDVRERVELIERMRVFSNIPEDASVRVALSESDRRLLSKVVRFGSLSQGLVERTQGGVPTLASQSELEAAIRDLRERGKAEHAMLAETLSSSLPGAAGRGSLLAEVYSPSERKESGAFSWGKRYAGQKSKGAFKLNVKHTDARTALRWAEQTYERFGLDVYEDLPDLERNYRMLQKKMKHGTVRRINMPVIEPENIDDFVADLRSGRVDIFEPWAEEHIGNLFPWQRAGNPPLELGDSSWIRLGVRDGMLADDQLPVGSVKPMSVRKLKPLQNEIWFDKLIATMLAFGPAGPGSFPTTKGVAITSSDGYIIDGHHRFGQIYLTDPNLPMQVLEVPLDRDKLLALARSYGTALGHASKG